jgi:Sec-independent protein secretion pathway component TatC
VNTREKVIIWIKIALSLAAGFLITYPVWLYGRQFLIH